MPAATAVCFAGVHELKFGGGWRKTPVQTQQIWPGSHMVASWDGYPNMFVKVARDYASNTDAQYINGYVTDTIALSRLTLTGGLRVDHQVSSLEAASVPAVAGFANLLPAISTSAASGVFVWNSFTPRVGFTLALDEARKTIVRGSYAMFASQLPASQAAFASPIQYAYAYYNAVDRNEDGVAQLNEVLIDQGLQGYVGFDPKNPSAAVNRVASDQKAPRTQEFLAGFDKELTPHLSVSATFTYRVMQDLPWTPLTGVTSANYSQTATLTGTAPIIGSLQRAAVRPERVGRPSRRRQDVRRSRRVSPALHGPRSQRDQAPLQPLDGAGRVLHQRLARILRRPVEVDPRSDARARSVAGVALRGTAGGWRNGDARLHRQRQERHLHGGAVVSVRRQRPVRGDLGHQRERESRRRDRDTPSRISRATSRRAIRSGTRRSCWCRTSTTTGCRR